MSELQPVEYILAALARHANTCDCGGVCNDAAALIEAALSAGAVPSPPPVMRTRHGGNVASGTPFFLQLGQREPEYDQGDSVIVWYDDLYDLALRATASAAPC